VPLGLRVRGHVSFCAIMMLMTMPESEGGVSAEEYLWIAEEVRQTLLSEGWAPPPRPLRHWSEWPCMVVWTGGLENSDPPHHWHACDNPRNGHDGIHHCVHRCGSTLTSEELSGP